MHGDFKISVNEIQIACYNLMLSSHRKVPNCDSFYCFPSNENDVPLFSGKYTIDVYCCPRCRHQMEISEIDSGNGCINAYFCKTDDLHWVYDCYCPVPQNKWYGPFPGNPAWVAKHVFHLENKAEYIKRGNKHLQTMLYCLSVCRKISDLT